MTAGEPTSKNKKLKGTLGFFPPFLLISTYENVAGKILAKEGGFDKEGSLRYHLFT
jgi:hypothetical protein